LIPTNTIEIDCPACNGRGILPTPDGKKWQLCPRCGGRGRILVNVDSYFPVRWRRAKMEGEVKCRRLVEEY